MCGLFGHTGFRPDRVERSRRALGSLAHRGPDQWGEWQEDGVYIGHRRLSILDLSENGRQPMRDPASRVVVSVNGEIYNYQALKSELSRHRQFQSESDSEVVLHGYLQWGIRGLLGRLEGMYAICVFDPAAGKIFLARDRAGIKPLYYSNLGGRVAWASELKALTEFHGPELLQVDPEAVYDYLTYLYVPTPKTLYKGLRKLPPAHLLEIDPASGTARESRYWELPTEVAPRGREDAVDELRGLLRESVRSHMVSDVPAGFFLSGGVDSTLVVGTAAALGGSLETYSIGFEDKLNDESAFAALAAETFGARHHSKVLGNGAFQALFPRLREWYDEPFSDSSAIACYLVSEFAAERLKVVLTGDGGDEIFGGYHAYATFLKYQKYRGPLGRLVGSFASLMPRRKDGRSARGLALRVENRFLLGDIELWAKLMGGMLKEEKAAYRHEFGIPADYDDYWYFRKFWREDLPVLTRLQYLDFHTYLHDDILTKLDRTSMAVSIEARVPLLSRSLIEFSFSLPEKVRFAGGLKGLLKSAGRGLVPPAILERGKKGFSTPSSLWKGLPQGTERTRQEIVLHSLFRVELEGLRASASDPARAEEALVR